MPQRNLADPDWEPSDEDFAELLEHAAKDVAATKARVEQALGESVAAALASRAVPPPPRAAE